MLSAFKFLKGEEYHEVMVSLVIDHSTLHHVVKCKNRLICTVRYTKYQLQITYILQFAFFIFSLYFSRVTI